MGDDAGFYPNEMGIMNDHQHLTFGGPIHINEKGYIYIWVSNQSEDTKVWFDDLTVEFSGVHVTQATDYGVWGDVIREAKTDESIYRFGYQGLYAEKDEETGWNHFELRAWNPLIGRWLVTDPFQQFHSPYVGMGNNPVGSVDPRGGTCYDANGNVISCGDLTEFEGPDQHITILDEVITEWGWLDEAKYIFDNTKIDVNFDMKMEVNAGLLFYSDLGFVGTSKDFLSARLLEIRSTGHYDLTNSTGQLASYYDHIGKDGKIKLKSSVSIETKPCSGCSILDGRGAIEMTYDLNTRQCQYHKGYVGGGTAGVEGRMSVYNDRIELRVGAQEDASRSFGIFGVKVEFFGGIQATIPK